MSFPIKHGDFPWFCEFTRWNMGFIVDKLPIASRFLLGTSRCTGRLSPTEKRWWKVSTWILWLPVTRLSSTIACWEIDDFPIKTFIQLYEISNCQPWHWQRHPIINYMALSATAIVLFTTSWILQLVNSSFPLVIWSFPERINSQNTIGYWLYPVILHSLPFKNF